MRHHAIICTSWQAEGLARAHAEAERLGLQCSPISDKVLGTASFCVFPDGSKEGWDESDAGDRRRDAFVAWLRDHWRDDEEPEPEGGSCYVTFAEVQYGDDNMQCGVTRASEFTSVVEPEFSRESEK